MTTVPLGCLCGEAGRVPCEIGQTVTATCSICGFEWRVSRTQTNRGVELTVRPVKSGTQPIEFKDAAGKTLRVEPGTAFPPPA